MPAVLKNALDIASRPFTASPLNGKPGAIVSISPGKVGGFGGNHHLRQVAMCLNILLMQQPEAYIGGIAELVNEHSVADPAAQAFLAKFADSFAEWIDRLL